LRVDAAGGVDVRPAVHLALFDLVELFRLLVIAEEVDAICLRTHAEHRGLTPV
jgi:hypothetical protein